MKNAQTHMWKQQVASGFGNAADHYDDHSPVQRASAKHLARLCPALGDAPDILEIGCGTGALTKRLIEKYPKANLHITDISPAMIAHAQSVITACNISWSVMDGEAPTLDKKYDLIVSNMAMQWFENREAALTNLAASLKPNGTIFYAMPGPKSFSGWRETLNDLNLPSGILNFETPPHVIDEQEQIITYSGAHDFLKSIKAIGAHKPKQGYAPISTAALRKACNAFDARFQGRVNWHILFARHQ
jgi:malonyl-CoA O-methyltransferase